VAEAQVEEAPLCHVVEFQVAEAPLCHLAEFRVEEASPLCHGSEEKF
jgi:hypothetical protein